MSEKAIYNRILPAITFFAHVVAIVLAVDNRGGIKISDFGISKKVEESESVSYRCFRRPTAEVATMESSDLLTSASRMHRPSLQGSVFWMAPEVVKQTSYTAKADVWSLGCLIVEMFTGHHPWMELTQMQAIFKVSVHERLRALARVDFGCRLGLSGTD